MLNKTVTVELRSIVTVFCFGYEQVAKRIANIRFDSPCCLMVSVCVTLRQNPPAPRQASENPLRKAAEYSAHVPSYFWKNWTLSRC